MWKQICQLLCEQFLVYAAEENLEAVTVAEVTEKKRLVLEWRGKEIVNISRAFLNTNGAHQETNVVVNIPSKEDNYLKKVSIPAVKEALDKEDFIPDAYILEVSSPGLGRTLKKDRHFEKSMGQDVEVKLFKAVDGKKEFEGTLTGFDSESVTITVENKEQTFLRSDIAIIRLALDF